MKNKTRLVKNLATNEVEFFDKALLLGCCFIYLDMDIFSLQNNKSPVR